MGESNHGSTATGELPTADLEDRVETDVRVSRTVYLWAQLVFLLFSVYGVFICLGLGASITGRVAWSVVADHLRSLTFVWFGLVCVISLIVYCSGWLGRFLADRARRRLRWDFENIYRE